TTAALALGVAVAGVFICDRTSEAPPSLDRALVVAVAPGPSSWYPGAHGRPVGFDADLVARYAESRGINVKFLEASDAADVLHKAESGAAHRGVGGLYAQPADEHGVMWTNATFAVEPVVIYHVEAAKPRSFKDLAGIEVAHSAGLDALVAAHREVDWRD